VEKRTILAKKIQVGRENYVWVQKPKEIQKPYQKVLYMQIIVILGLDCYETAHSDEKLSGERE